MNTNQPHAFPHEVADHRQAFVLNHRVLFAAIHVEHQRAGAIEHRRVRRPAAFDQDRRYPSVLPQTFLEQDRAGVELMLSTSVARLARNKHDLGGSGRENPCGRA